ncbi:MAG: hypothetical protein PHE78_00420 [Candidatus Gastranaerophilales bacterium]|nr:hypothetical protein [Candidatus Gastranaerophilales bacterium]
MLEWIYKRRCYFCRKPDQEELMCADCYANIRLNPPIESKTIGVHKIYCATMYQNEMQKLIRAIKYHNKKDLSKQAAMILRDFWKKIENKEYNYEIIPMPIYKSRQRQRSYNQSELIAIEFAQYFGYEINTKLVRRIKNTPPLYKLSKQERENVLSGAFEYIGENYSGRPVLIIDDICTSATSAKELINELKRHGVYDITVLTCAQAGSFYQI